MNQFPVSSSILSAAHLGPFLLEQYGLQGPVSCSLIKAGVNHTYLVAAGDTKYIFRIYSLNWRTENDIAEELRLVSYLRESNIPVSYPFADKDGNYIQHLPAPEGERFAVLFSYATGEKMHNFFPDTHAAIGSVMAGIHKQTEGFRLQRASYTPKTLLVDSFKELEKFIAAETEEMQFMSSTQDYLLNEFEKVDTTQLRNGAVHLDIWFDNLHIDTHNHITIFDFDFCGNGWLCLDIAYYLMQLQVLEPDPNEYCAKAAAFLNGYESVTPITDEERRILPTLGVAMYFFYLGVQCCRFEDYSNMFINETYLKRYINLRVKRFFYFHKLGGSS
jgi:Ser/Thr protein kinase RdoA (MazF antagonist)